MLLPPLEKNIYILAMGLVVAPKGRTCDFSRILKLYLDSNQIKLYG